MTVKKIIIVGLIVVMLESIAGYIYLTYSTKDGVLPEIVRLSDPSPIPSPADKKASLRLVGSANTIKQGDTFKVDVSLNSFSTPVSAADLTLKYDPAFLTVQATSSAQPFEVSPTFQKTVFNALSAKSGIATFSAVADPGKEFSGNGILTSLSFSAKKAGSTNITIVFTPGETRDTNVVADTKDILESVENLSVNILQ